MRMLRRKLSENAALTGYLHDKIFKLPQRTCRPCILLCPGGGYQDISQRESDPVAMEFFAHGYQVFILSYSIRESAQNLQPLKEASDAMVLLRENAFVWDVQPNHIAIMGFSAGGHLSASLGTLWDSPQLKAITDTRGGLNRPDAMVLGYPVITTNSFTHSGSVANLTGGQFDSKTMKLLSLEKQVTEKTPPTFLWATAADELVPVENTLWFAQALQKAHISYELHIFPYGAHGLSTCTADVGTENRHNALWLPLCKDWLDTQFDFSA